MRHIEMSCCQYWQQPDSGRDPLKKPSLTVQTNRATSQCPFKDWGKTDQPTRDLPWYDAYNAVKHAREENFNRATLEHCLQAVSACAIMNCAQFGTSGGFGNAGELKYFFRFSQLPEWLPSEVYSHPYENRKDGRGAVNYPFD
jgi:hypothetical protein